MVRTRPLRRRQRYQTGKLYGLAASSAVITRFNGKDIQGVHDLTPAVVSQKPGSNVTGAANQRGKHQELALIVDRSKDQEEQTGAIPTPRTEEQRLGLSLSAIPDEAGQQLGLQADATGVLVQDVGSDSLAGESGIRPGDVIVSAKTGTRLSRPTSAKNGRIPVRRKSHCCFVSTGRDNRFSLPWQTPEWLAIWRRDKQVDICCVPNSGPG
jgi:predicted metalloprotease with PDZ domain